MDNTLLERSFKAIATGRKNYLFLDRETAGPTAAILYTLVRNAANHNLDIHSYLRDVIEKVPVLMAEGKPLDELLPDQWALANPDNKVDPKHWTVFCRFLASEIPLGISLVPVTQA